MTALKTLMLMTLQWSLLTTALALARPLSAEWTAKVSQNSHTAERPTTDERVTSTMTVKVSPDTGETRVTSSLTLSPSPDSSRPDRGIASNSRLHRLKDMRDTLAATLDSLTPGSLGGFLGSSRASRENPSETALLDTREHAEVTSFGQSQYSKVPPFGRRNDDNDMLPFTNSEYSSISRVLQNEYSEMPPVTKNEHSLIVARLIQKNDYSEKAPVRKATGANTETLAEMGYENDSGYSAGGRSLGRDKKGQVLWGWTHRIARRRTKQRARSAMNNVWASMYLLGGAIG